MKRRFEGQVAWITGGGSGIGRALALHLAEEGATVAVSGRRQDRLDEVVDAIRAADGRALAVPVDVTDETSVEAAAARVVGELGRMDVVLANAGFSVGGRVEALSAEDWRRQLDTNVVGLAVTAKHALPHLRERRGRLGLVGSVAGLAAFPGFAAYHASKYAVRAIGQCLAGEVHGSGVSVTLLHPGFVESEIGQVDNHGKLRAERPDPRPARLMWTAPRAAAVMTHALWRRRRELVFTGHGKLAAFLGQHFPGLVHLLVTRGRAWSRRRARRRAAGRAPGQ
jgi:NAD(P)-dependent dehydrogenase (short-subunit alcohol dehydrogenase family)